MWLRNISHFIEICLLFAVAMPTIGQLLYQVDPDHRIAYRKYERTCLKLINTKNAVVFNRTCLREKDSQCQHIQKNDNV